MRIFLLTLLVSTVASIALWNSGLAHKIWPAHPILATTMVAAACGVAAQRLLSHDAHKDSTRN